MLPQPPHVHRKQLLERRKTPAFRLKFHEPRLTVRHTRDSVGHPALRGRLELVSKPLPQHDGPHKISFDLAFSHKKMYCMFVKESLVSVSQQSTEVI